MNNPININENDSNLPQNQPESNQKEKLAQMAGHTEEIEETEINNEVNNSHDVELSSVTTKVSVWRKIGARTAAIAGVTLAGVSFFAVLGRGFTEFFNQKEEPKTVQKPQPVKENDQKNIAELETKVALGTQQAQLEKLKSQASIPKSSPETTVKVTPKPEITPKSSTPTISIPKVVPTHKVINVTTSPKPFTRYGTVPAVEPQAIPTHSSKSIVLQPKPIQPKTSAKTTVKVERFSKQAKPPQPIVQAPSTPDIQQSKSLGKAEKSKAKTNVQVVTSDLPVTRYSNTQISNTQILMVGTRADARLQSTIVLNDENLNANSQKLGYKKANNKGKKSGFKSLGVGETTQTYPIKFTEDLKNPDGKVIIPKKSLLIIKPVFKNGLWELFAISIVTYSKEGGTVEKRIPEGAILVQKRDGSPLRGEFKTVAVTQSKDDDETDMNTMNYTTNTNRTSRLPVRHGIDPVHNESAKTAKRLNKEQRANNSRVKQYVSSNKVFTLKKDFALQIYVNRSFDF